MRWMTTVVVAVVVVGAAAPLAAQQPQQQPGSALAPPKTFTSIFATGYTDAGALKNGENSWNLGSGVGIGASMQRQLKQGLTIGLEGTYVPSVGMEVSHPGAGGSAVTEKGNGSISTAMATGRISTGGGGGVGLYLAGGAGLVGYSMPALAGLNSRFETDFGFRTSAGLEYQFSRRNHLFLEWGKIWALHPGTGVDKQTNKFTQLRGGMRIGW
ncbi:MAG TPA: hypothetical protein VFQ38_08620 [Longimicrobiales bacterium]|nr:hypothetical protein [Longimicrobiales bacterium]